MLTATSRPKGAGLHEAAWPDMFVNLQTAYAELSRVRGELEHRAAEVQRAHDLFQHVIQSMSEALFLLDLQGRVVQTNPAASALLELPEADLLGQSFQELWPASGLPTTPWQLVNETPTDSLQDSEVEVQTRSGRVIPVSASCGLVRDKRAKLLGMVVVARDITERKRAEAALAQQAAELARSNAELEQFAYVASHDLQEPLRMMSSFGQLLADSYKGRLDADADEFIGYIVDGARRMQQLISDLLRYSRVGTRGAVFAPVSCAEVLAQCRRNLQLAIEESGARIAAGRLPTVMGDATQLAQLLQNLLANAIKFRGPRQPRIRVGARRTGDRWLLWVRDNGIGIAPQYSDRIFMIFQRLHDRDEYPGTGIGLALCKKIVERHAGKIWIESQPGQGTTVYFTLPSLERSPS